MTSSSELRQRHAATSQSSSGLSTKSETAENFMEQNNASVTALPFLQANGQPATERTAIPMTRQASDSTSSTTTATTTTVAKSEGKVRKILTRAISGALMIGLFLGMMYMGHLYICLLVALVELLLVCYRNSACVFDYFWWIRLRQFLCLTIWSFYSLTISC
jgi:hypothetical protein